MIEALNRIAEAQERQHEEFSRVREELCEIKDSIKRIHAKLDETAEKTTINTERVKSLKDQFLSEKKENSDKFDIVHESIRRRDNTLRWLFASVLIPIVLAIVAIFKPTP